ncbi:MAG: nucleoside triphosphate pyrophosphohydrolase [gamma proteobacterium endosymbiont of Lamellibrachia anaximandri]|nr:nucleoside triphosphate pyrophosphohydrolase [gamma proteobacterium endosymbiont of Lamellibrachia anaximandri]MBL3618921.1 nucleoside triphosphate pyrophosphohydrolase [gamma proteobacterium endosymbiont of Lamellibrachia anaximandri]
MSASLERLIEIMARLRDPEKGCPWDREQTFETVVPYTIEEAYEVEDVIQQGDMPGLCEELGDLLFQIVFHARMAEEAGEFVFDDVVCAINDKMVRRHPHVFAEEKPGDRHQQRQAWESHKSQERKKKAGYSGSGALHGVATALPALMRAEKLQKRAARTGFDWPDIAGASQKIDEELAECQSAIQSGVKQEIEEEIGDLLFSCVNLARHADVDAESALRQANRKFSSRFSYMEGRLGEQAKTIRQLSTEELDQLWEEAKSTGAGQRTT